MRNFIFDLYGTLVDVLTDEWSDDFWRRNSDYLHSLTKTDVDFKRQFDMLSDGISPDDERETDIAGMLTELFRKGGADYSKERIYEIGSEIRAKSTQKLRLYPNVADGLQALRKSGGGLYILSNAQALFTQPELEMLGLTPMFDGVELSSDFGYKKPSVRFFDHLIYKYGLSRADSIFIGNDYRNDILGAIGAGLDAVYIRTESSPVDAEPARDFPDRRHFLNGSHAELFSYLLSLCTPEK